MLARRLNTSRYLVAAVAALVWLSGMARSAGPNRPADAAAIIGQPTELTVEPSKIELIGPRALQQIVVTGKYADGSIRDLTWFCEVTTSAPEVARVDANERLLRPLKEGSTQLIVKAGGKEARAAITVKDFASVRPIGFRHEVIAALNVGGCNSGACHGTPTGKNGFKLSLRGFEPEADFVQLTRDVLGRRLNRLDADASMLLLKGVGKIPHEGGKRFNEDSLAANTIRDWIREGLNDDPAGLARLVKIEVAPGRRLLKSPAQFQQLSVRAFFSDNTSRDVTRLTVFTSSDEGVASVDAGGLVTFKMTGEIAILCRFLDQLQAVRLVYLDPKPDFQWPNPPAHNFVDEHVLAKLKLLSIPPSDLCADHEFIRRAYMDLCAILPNPDEVKAFLDDKAADKRAKLVDKLLERPEFADFWTMKWMDVLRSTRRNLNEQGADAYQKWLREQITQNTPIDKLVSQLLTAQGNSFEVGPANYYRVSREPNELAETTAQLFFGIRMQCAKCHNHPFERWTQDDYYSLSAFFAQVDVKTPSGKKPTKDGNKKAEPEIVKVDLKKADLKHPRTGKPVLPGFPGGIAAKVAPDQDRRTELASWLVAADNPFFARSVVNRIWYHLLGRGIVDPVDDFRDSNPPANDELLDALAKELAARNYDMRHVIRTIMQSRTYQLSARSSPGNADDLRYFSHAYTKLLSAEQLLDALCLVTEVPEKFDKMPMGMRAVQLPDGDVNNPFLKTFGQPARELACECERESDSNLGQALQLINGATLHTKLINPKNRLARLMGQKIDDQQLLEELYLAALARRPSDKEANVTLGFLEKAANKRQAWEDVLWALFNSKEFMFRH